VAASPADKLDLDLDDLQLEFGRLFLKALDPVIFQVGDPAQLGVDSSESVVNVSNSDMCIPPGVETEQAGTSPADSFSSLPVPSLGGHLGLDPFHVHQICLFLDHVGSGRPPFW
jgi:hypothetical protein